MDTKTFADVHATMPEVDSIPAAMWKNRAIKAERKLEALELVASYAKDVIDFWPSMSFKTIRFMIPKMDALKEALSLVK
jgi:hypothetical protein